jgi:hypothetical protein
MFPVVWWFVVSFRRKQMKFRFLKVVVVATVVILLCGVLPGLAEAHVTSGGNCANCHDPTTNRFNITSAITPPTSTSLNPRLDGGSTAPLPMFTVRQGDTLSLIFNVTDGGNANDEFAVALTGTLKGGVLESLVSSSTVRGIKTSTADLLAFTADPAWNTRTSGGKTYYTRGPFSWTGSTTAQTFNLAINPATPLDVYSLTCRTTGVDSSFGMWTQAQEILLNVVAVPEPASLLLLAAPLGTLFLRRRRHG